MATSILKPKFTYTPRTIEIDATNDQITIRDASGGADKVGTVEHGVWAYGDLAYKVQVAIKSSAAGLAVYTGRYSYTTQKFTFTSDLSGGATAFEIRYGGANDISGVLGFSAHQTGAATYTGTAVPATATLTFTKTLKNPQPRRVFDREDLVLENGKSESTVFGNVGLYPFGVDHEPRATAVSFDQMIEAAGGRGAILKFYPDSTLSSYVDVVMVQKDFPYREMTADGMYGFYAFDFQLRIANPNTGDLTFNDLLNRGPS